MRKRLGWLVLVVGLAGCGPVPVPAPTVPTPSAPEFAWGGATSLDGVYVYTIKHIKTNACFVVFNEFTASDGALQVLRVEPEVCQ